MPYLLRQRAPPRMPESLGVGSFGLAFTWRENHDEVITHMAGEDQQLARFRKFHVVAAWRRDHDLPYRLSGSSSSAGKRPSIAFGLVGLVGPVAISKMHCGAGPR